MPLFAFEGREPDVSPGAWIAPTATLVGDVRVEAEASIWYGAVLRADFGPIIVRRGANIQDGSVLHGGDDPGAGWRPIPPSTASWPAGTRPASALSRPPHPPVDRARRGQRPAADLPVLAPGQDRPRSPLTRRPDPTGPVPGIGPRPRLPPRPRAGGRRRPAIRPRDLALPGPGRAPPGPNFPPDTTTKAPFRPPRRVGDGHGCGNVDPLWGRLLYMLHTRPAPTRACGSAPRLSLRLGAYQSQRPQARAAG